MCSTSDPTIEFKHYKIDVKLLKFEMLQYYKIIYIKINFFWQHLDLEPNISSNSQVKPIVITIGWKRDDLLCLDIRNKRIWL